MTGLHSGKSDISWLPKTCLKLLVSVRESGHLKPIVPGAVYCEQKQSVSEAFLILLFSGCLKPTGRSGPGGPMSIGAIASETRPKLSVFGPLKVLLKLIVSLLVLSPLHHIHFNFKFVNVPGRG
jgi:hypothetical protein